VWRLLVCCRTSGKGVRQQSRAHQQSLTISSCLFTASSSPVVHCYLVTNGRLFTVSLLFKKKVSVVIFLQCGVRGSTRILLAHHQLLLTLAASPLPVTRRQFLAIDHLPLLPIGYQQLHIISCLLSVASIFMFNQE
jgi:hypothetical protein